MDKPKWSDLPKDLLTMIAKLLDTRMDTLRLRAVCTSWRSSVPLKKSRLPVELPFPITPNDAVDRKLSGFFSLTGSTIYRLEPPADTLNASASNVSLKGWLVRVEEAKPGKMRLLNPFSKDSVERLPKSFPKVLNLLNFRVSEVDKAYSIQFVNLHNRQYRNFEELRATHVRKVAVSWTTADDYAIMALHGKGKLGFLKSGDEKWTIIDGGEGSHFDDVIYHRGQFYAVDFRGKTLVIDSSLRVTVVAPSLYCLGGQYKHLVASSRDLLLVERHIDPEPEFYYDWEEDDYAMSWVDPDYPIQFKVYRLKEEEQRWAQVDSVGHRLLLVGDGFSYCVSARDFPGCQGNCIFFTEEYFAQEDDGEPGSDAGLFNIEDKTVGPLASFPAYSQIIWPPPTWLRPNPRSSSSRS